MPPILRTRSKPPRDYPPQQEVEVTRQKLGFDWKAAGESTYDYMLVQVAPTFKPVAGTIPAGVTVLAQINLQTAFGRTTLQLSGNFNGSAQRLIFTWRNAGSLDAQPPATIDNVTVISQAANPISGSYTINSALSSAATNFISFIDAATRLNQDGISGPVTLTVSGSPYRAVSAGRRGGYQRHQHHFGGRQRVYHPVCFDRQHAASGSAAQRHRLYHRQQPEH